MSNLSLGGSHLMSSRRAENLPHCDGDWRERCEIDGIMGESRIILTKPSIPCYDKWNNYREHMPLSMTPERFAAIRQSVMKRRAESLVAEIAATDWDKQPHFSNLDDFLAFADTFVEPSENPSERSRKRPR
jgi:Zn-finger nucleic acid-binding protein